MGGRHVAFVSAVAHGLTAVLPKWPRIATRARVAADLVPVVEVATEAGPLKFYTPSKTAIYWPRHAFTAEPDTLRWIASFPAGSVLWDIGASVGCYALYAGLKGTDVFCFEANPYTYICLAHNIRLNDLASKVRAYCVAVSDVPGVDELFMPNFDAGTTGNALGNPSLSTARENAGSATVPILSLSMDMLASDIKVPIPTHVKIDVDSIEEKIVRGGASVFSNSRVRSVLIEEVETKTPAGSHHSRLDRIHEMMAKCGFSCVAEEPRRPTANRIYFRT